MTNIISSTYNLLDALDNSSLIKNLTSAKKNLENNKHILSLIETYKKETRDEKKLLIKKELYLNEDYKLYMDSYNELSLIALKINKQYQKYTHTKIHACH